jgi:hypothetical protein
MSKSEKILDRPEYISPRELMRRWGLDHERSPAAVLAFFRWAFLGVR